MQPKHVCTIAGLSHPFLGMGPGPLELGKLAAFRLKLGKSILSICTRGDQKVRGK